MTERRRYAFDLDGTLCDTDGGDYVNARPIAERVAVVRALWKSGAYIIIHTARGDLATPEQRRKILSMTRAQLSSWGLRYHELRPKPFAHFYVDDRAVYADHFFAKPHTGGN